MNRLTGDETIRDVLSSLMQPEAYLAGVLGNMTLYRRQVSEPTVTIGITGLGIVPHYRLQPADEHEPSLESLQAYWENVAAFDGRNHKKKEWSIMEIRAGNWSSGSMDFKSVQRLLGELRGYKGQAKA